ncbi:hypothetical protein HV449_19715 [Bacillus sporothermodurans]|nr:hypothetical protein [Heyndrickxia sporothermodurans]MBL5809054.1 hypothetical protein [Heyndrickxia sporothermodurans]MBL5858961.1 hypothetical protein [Heyndrickxia sporothermodurans]MBL5871911.1 hypothetical protein [Heyndrickxia sporothermodurans]
MNSLLLKSNLKIYKEKGSSNESINQQFSNYIDNGTPITLINVPSKSSNGLFKISFEENPLQLNLSPSLYEDDYSTTVKWSIVDAP